MNLPDSQASSPSRQILSVSPRIGKISEIQEVNGIILVLEDVAGNIRAGLKPVFAYYGNTISQFVEVKDFDKLRWVIVLGIC